MLRYFFPLLILFHGLLHLMGFAKAFDGNITQLTQAISKPLGILWMMAALLFIATALLLFMKKDMWTIFAVIAVVISQALIISVWQDAKYGSIINVLILLAVLWLVVLAVI